MKALKKITLALMLVVFLTLNCGGCFLFNNTYKIPAYSQRTYVEPDEEEINQSLDELVDLTLSSGNETKILIKRSRLMSAFYKAFSSAVVAQIEYYKDVTVQENAERATKSENFLNAFQNKLLEAEKALFTSSYAEYFTELTSEEYKQSILSYQTKSAEILALEAQITALENEYGTQSVNPNAERMAEIYAALVTARNKIARATKKADGTYYKNYHEYAYAEIYGRDYTPEQAANFRTMLASAFTPLKNDLAKLNQSFLLDFKTTEEDLKTYIPKIVEYTDSSMLDSWQYMMEYELYDFSAGENKMNTSFVIEFPEYGDGFLFLRPNGSFIADVSTLTHEFGHYNAIFKVDEQKDGMATSNFDIAETHSQCFELLTLPSVKRLLTELDKADYYSSYAYYMTENFVWAFLSNCAFDKFEYDVYSANENTLTKEWLESTWTNAANAYWPEMNYEYYEVPHLFSSPGYCISYSVSLLFSSEIWAQQNNLEVYKNLVSYGKNHRLSDVCNSIGIAYPLTQTAIDSAVSAYKGFISTTFGIDYDINGGGNLGGII